MDLSRPPVASLAQFSPRVQVRVHGRALPLRVGSRASPLALTQTGLFLDELAVFCPPLRNAGVFEQHPIRTTGDASQACGARLADIGGKGLFAKEIHEALADGRIDFAVHSLKDLETTLPPGIVLACTLKREDARDALILADRGGGLDALGGDDPFVGLGQGAVIGSASVRRQAQLLHRRPDLRVVMVRGNVQTRLDRLETGSYDATLLAFAGLRRLGATPRRMVAIDPEVMVPAAGQGIIGITVREEEEELRELLAAIEDLEAKAVATAERALLATLDGSCRTPIGGYAVVLPEGRLRLTGLVAREDGSFLLKRSLEGGWADAARLGRALGEALRRDSPDDVFL
uniref:Porphobilinogen deaminase n=1 Tax=Acidicaldus sp. TaxID=1872105 RepID=A0A8J4HAS3_9PROT